MDRTSGHSNFLFFALLAYCFQLVLASGSDAWLQAYMSTDPHLTTVVLSERPVSPKTLSALLGYPCIYIPKITSVLHLKQPGRWYMMYFTVQGQNMTAVHDLEDMQKDLKLNIRAAIVEVPRLEDYLLEQHNKNTFPIIYVSLEEPESFPLLACPFSLPKKQMKASSDLEMLCGNLLQNRRIPVSIVGVSPYVTYSATGVGGSDLDVLRIISAKFGFTYDLTLERVWYNYFNGTAKGTFASIDRGESAIGIGCTTPDIYVNGPPIDIETTFHLYALQLAFFGPQPKPILPVWNLIKPYDYVVWTSFFMVLVSVMLLSHVGKMLTPLTMFMIVCGQSTKYNTSRGMKASSQLLYIGWIAFILIIILSYECNLRAFIVAVDFEKPIDSSYDVWEQNKKLYIPRGSGHVNYMATSTLWQYRELAKRVIEDDSLYTFTSGFIPADEETQIHEEGSVFVLDKEMAYSQFAMVKRQDISYKTGKELYALSYVKFLLQRHMPWNDALRAMTARLSETGIITYNIQKYSNVKFRDKARAGVNNVQLQPFGILHILGSLVIFLFGIAGALVMFSVEMLFHKT